ncbi:MAG: hypothetical protein DMF80_10410 [Acidobacteria bacterium]|nr:MAG: hypothetical protein DMF80_10410 [Acidobacteriota bacterium]PYQ22589.1 MAG: hypothetical protein DMF81_11675 [Acidobacteriota bacterium]
MEARTVIAGLALFLACFPRLAADASLADGESGVLVRDPVAFLRAEIGLTATELGTLERGGDVARVIDTGDRREVLSFAVMRVRTTPARVLERLRDLEGRRQAPWVLQIGRLGPAPSAPDFEALTLDQGDVKHLAKCQVNDCDMRLPADAIERFRTQVDWSSAYRTGRANKLFRDMLQSGTAAYLKQGNPALFEYVNNNDPVRIADSLEELLRRSRFLYDAAPDLFTFLQRFPEARPADAEDFVYWIKERFWLLNVLSVNHVVLVNRATPSGWLVLAVSKQLYANHYYESSLGVTAFVGGKESGSYLVFINRTRADIRRSGFTWPERTLLKYLVRGRLEGQLKYLRPQLESP